MTLTERSSSLDFELGRRLVALTMGIDALERAQSQGNGPLDGEGLVPIFLGGRTTAARFHDWAAARVEVDAFEAATGDLMPGPRKSYLQAMARSLRAIVVLFSGGTLPFKQKLSDIVGIPAEPVPDDAIAAIHDRVDALLSARGITGGSLPERVKRWQTDRFLDPDSIPAIYDELLAEAKRRTDRMIFPTGDYSMRINTMRGVPYAGRCNFNEGTMDINLDVAVTRASLKHLVTHEVFPGHSTQLLATKAAVDRGEVPADALLCTANSIPGSIQEGIGDQGTELIDWVEDEDDALQIELRRAQTATGTNAVYHLNESGWTPEQSIAYLQETGFGQESWARVRTKMAMHPFRGPFLGSYWFGCEAVREVRSRTPAEAMPAFISFLYRQVNSPESLRQFHG
jgi:hypothetical protein